MLLPAFLISCIALLSSIVRYLCSRTSLSTALSYPLGTGLAMSVVAFGYYLSLIFNVQIEILLVCFLLSAILIFRLSMQKGDSLASRVTVKPTKQEIIFILLGIALLTFRFTLYIRRWGEWDAWGIWNLHAKFMFYPESWREMFASEMIRTHPDYPLMLPLLIAFIWRGVNGINLFVPILISNFVLLAIATSLLAAIKKSSNIYFASLSLVILIIDKKFIQLSASQYADTLLAFFILMSFILYHETKRASQNRIFIILGFTVASAAWIKNEGLLFFLCFSIIFSLFTLKSFRKAFWFFAGTAIPIAVLISFKAFLAPQNDLINTERGTDLIALLTNPERYLIILKFFTLTLLQYHWALLILAALFVFKIKKVRISLPLATITLVGLGYFSIYLTTPNDLTWHLSASVDRLFHQYHPACLFLLISGLGASFIDRNLLTGHLAESNKKGRLSSALQSGDSPH